MGVFQKKMGERIKVLRKAAGWTQQELADRAKMDYKYVGAVETARKNITLANIERIAKALGCEPYELFLFTWGDDRGAGGKLDEKVLLNLVRNSDPRIRPLLVQVAEVLMRWSLETKRV